MQQPCCVYYLQEKIAFTKIAVFEALFVTRNFMTLHESGAEVALSSQACVSARLLGQ
jgi:hypothetical protein